MAPPPTPSPEASPSPTLDPSPPPTESPTDQPGTTPPGTERPDLRTAYSDTFEQSNGSFITDLYADQRFYQPAGSTDWQPIDLSLSPANDNGVLARAGHAPAQVDLSAADNPAGYLAVDGGGHTISFGLPDGTAAGRAGTPPVISADSVRADYTDFLPGGVGLRVFPHSDGFKSFLVIPSKPSSNTFSLRILASGLKLANDPEVDDGLAFSDAQGNIVGRIPRPYLVDSTYVDGLGSGVYAEAVTQTVSALDGSSYLLALTVDPKYLDAATYPVYLDPTVTDFPTGSTTAQDTFAAERYPGSNFNTYQDPGGYYEMWLGHEPGYTTYDEDFIRFKDLDTVLGSVHIDSAVLKIYPWWQYYHTAQWETTWVERVSEDWGAGTLKWNNKPATDLALGSFETKETTWSADHGAAWENGGIQGYVQDIVNGTVANNGIKLQAASIGNAGWKRIVSLNDPSNKTPYLEVTWTAFAAPSVGYPSGGGETSSRTLNWVLPDAATQSLYDAQISTSSSCATALADSGSVTAPDTFWMVPTGTTLTDGTTYYWRVKVKYGINTSFSGWSACTSFVYRQGATLGQPAFDTFESFSPGSRDAASVNVSTGNLVISHPIVSLPTRGGAFSLTLTYNSQASTNVGTGPGWRLSAMRRLAEVGNGNVVFTAADGSVHTFTKISTIGTVTTYNRPPDIYATLRKDTSQALEWTVTYRDGTVDSFDQSGSEGLLAKQADRFGNAVTFAYYSGSNRLQQATDPNGRVVDFAWNTGASPAQLTSITDWAYVSSGVVQATNTGSRRQYRLFYDANGYLIGWSDPINTSGSCPSTGSHLTCLGYSGGLVISVVKHQTYAILTGSPITIGTNARDVTTRIYYRGNEVSEIRDAEQYNAGQTGTTFTRAAANQMQVIRQGTPASITTYGYVATTDSLGRVQSIWRRLGTTDIEQRTVWDSTFPTEPDSVTDNYGALLSTPARTVSYTYVGGSLGLVSVMTEPLTGSTNRTSTYTYNANNDVTQVVVASGGSSTTTRYCYTTSGCSTSGTSLTLNSMIENYVDGNKGGSGGNETDVTTGYQYDTYGQRTRETRYNYDASGNLLDSRAIGYVHDTNGNQTMVIVNYADGSVTSPGDDITPNATTHARTDLTTVQTYDTAGNLISSADPRRAIALAQNQNLNADDYVTRHEYDGLNQQAKSTAPRDPADSVAPKSSTSVYDELAMLRQTTDFGGLASATKFDRAGRALETYEDVDGAGSANALTTSVVTYDASGRQLTAKDRNQVGDASLGVTASTYDELGRPTEVTDASGTSDAATTDYGYDALDRQVSMTVGGILTTDTTYDLGGRALTIDDGFTCTTATFDYRDLQLTETTGLDSPGCSTGADKRAVTDTYDGLGRLTRTEVTYGADNGDRTFDVTLDAAGGQLTSAVKKSGVTSTTTFTGNPLDQLIVEASPDGSTAKTNYDAAGNPSDRCYWAPGVTVGSCYEVGHTPWSNPPTQVTTSAYDARNQRLSLTDGVSGTTTTYAPADNYQIAAFYVPTSGGHELQSLYTYDSRHRLSTITHQLCTISSGHNCSSTTSLGSDTYAYDDNDNRTTVNENNGATSSDRRYCYDAQDRLIYRNTGTPCSSSAKDESYAYDDAGNRTQSVVGGTTTNYAHNSAGQLCKVGGTNCTGANVTYDSAGQTASYNGWVYVYDAQGRLVKACKSTSCTGSVDRVEFSYDGDGHRTQIMEYVAGTLTTTRDFLYHGDAIVQEKTNGTVSREYVVDDSGRVVRFCDPNCASPTTSYLVTWNGHGDALAIYRINANGTLTLANSFTYSSWGAPTTATHNSISDLGFRFLYVGAADVQWDNFSGLGLYYMHARHYSPSIGRFLQADPARVEGNSYAYALDDPIGVVDSCGTASCDLVTYLFFKTGRDLMAFLFVVTIIGAASSLVTFQWHLVGGWLFGAAAFGGWYLRLDVLLKDRCGPGYPSWASSGPNLTLPKPAWRNYPTNSTFYRTWIQGRVLP